MEDDVGELLVGWNDPIRFDGFWVGDFSTGLVDGNAAVGTVDCDDGHDCHASWFCSRSTTEVI